MKVLLLALTLLISGCTDSPSNTQVSVDTGGAPFVHFSLFRTVSPPKIVQITSIDKTDLNAQSNVTYVLPAGAQAMAKPQTIKKPGVHLQGQANQTASKRTRLNCTGTWQQRMLTFTATADNCSVEDLDFAGHDGCEFIHLDQTSGFVFRGWNEYVSATKGGITPLTTNGSRSPTIQDGWTERVARYGLFFGWSNGPNTNFVWRNLKLGPCLSIEDSKISKRKASGPNGGGWSEHPGRVYGADTGLIDSCDFENPDNPDGKDGLKIMNGKNVTVQNSTINGSVRTGRDVNDPPSYTLTGTTFHNCSIKDYFRVDPGAKIALFSCSVTSHTSGQVFPMKGGSLYLQDTATAYTPTGKGVFSTNPQAIKVGPNVTFNGKLVP